jgi:alpha-maltose-1-phosphate synthase
MEEARLHCPSVRLVVVDGDDSARYRCAWAAADIFTSLADSFQETFGLTPIEAMSAALPSVVSDWNGYRDGVRDGIDGFRIPTLALAPDRSGDLADRYDLGVDDFDRHSGHTGQFVAIDVERAAEAYRSLIRDPALRRRMGHQARQRARVEFDWSVVFRRYQALWHELGDARRADRAPRETRRRPDRPDPFSMFESYSTHRLSGRTAFARCRGATPEKAAALRHAKSLSFATPVLPSGEVIDHVLSRVPDDEWVRLEDLAQGWPNHQAADCERALVWLAKVGILRFRDQA